SSGTSLSIPADKLDFGEVVESDQFSWVLPVTNETNHPVEIISFASSCGCVSLTPQNVVLSVGETCDIKVLLNLTSVPPGTRASNTARDEFNVKIAPVLKTSSPLAARSVAWLLHGRVKKAFEVTPNTIVFEEQQIIRGKPAKPALLRITAI